MENTDVRPALQWNFDGTTFSVNTFLGKYIFYPSPLVGYDLFFNDVKLAEVAFVEEAKEVAEKHFDDSIRKADINTSPTTFQFITSLVLSEDGREFIFMSDYNCQTKEEALGKAVIAATQKFPRSALKLWAIYELN